MCEFYLASPRKPKFKYPAVRPDVDNFLKALMDSLNGILWKDDSLIVEICAAKYYTKFDPHILMIVKELWE